MPRLCSATSTINAAESRLQLHKRLDKERTVMPSPWHGNCSLKRGGTIYQNGEGMKLIRCLSRADWLGLCTGRSIRCVHRPSQSSIIAFLPHPPLTPSPEFSKDSLRLFGLTMLKKDKFGWSGLIFKKAPKEKRHSLRIV